MKYRLIQDDACHWWACPADEYEEVRRIFDEIEEYWRVGDYENDPPETPDCVTPIDNPESITFTDIEL